MAKPDYSQYMAMPPEPDPEPGKPPEKPEKPSKQEDPSMVREQTKITGEEKKQRGLFKKRRAGIVLTKDQVEEIKYGRKKLRKEMRARGIYGRKEFELTAGSMGLYFDKSRFMAFLLWLFGGGWALWALIGAAAAALATGYFFSTVTQLRGHFTINMTGDMFKEGFTLSFTEDFVNPASYLNSDPVYDAPCTSISMLPEGLDSEDGSHNGKNYFATTFYIRNEGDSTVGYDYSLHLISESKKLSNAAWVMLFEDGEMRLFAKTNADGRPEALPSFADTTRGYYWLPYREALAAPEEQYQTITVTDLHSFYRVVPYPFESDTVVRTGRVIDIPPMEVHKYTVVMWLEGDDPDCTNELIGGHIGIEMQFKLLEESDYSSEIAEKKRR